MYSIKDAAQALGIHPKTIRRWEQAGKFIPQRTLGNQRRFTPRDLNTLKNIKTGYTPSANQPIDRLLTIDQAAQKLGVALATIQRWTKEGRLNLKVDNQLQSGYSAQQINSLLQSQKPQLAPSAKPPPAPFKPSQSTIPPVYLYTVIGSIILSLLVLGQLYLKNQALIAKPAISELNPSQPRETVLPQVANFLNGRITIGSDTGDLSFLDDKGNLFLKNSALVQGGVFSSYLQLLPSVKPEAQIGRHYVDKESGNLMYYDGLNWTALNQSATSSAALSSLSASASALILPYTVLGGADQEILTIDDNSSYPVLISQPTKILANLYAAKLLDSDSETYFIDPGAAGLSLSLAGNATISATLTFSQNNEYITNTTDNYLIFSGGLSIGGTTTYGFNKEGNINANKIEGHDIIQIDNLKLDNNTLSATNNDGLKLYDNDSNGIFIKDGGNVGIGTTAPTAKLEVAGSTKIGASYVGLGFTAPINGLLVEGNVGIGTTEPGYTLTVSGTAWVTSGAWSGSDVRWKKDIQPIAGALDKVLQLSGVSYNWRKDEFPENKFDDKTHLGLIAQDVEKIVPELVTTGPDDYKGIDFNGLAPLLIGAVQEQQTQIASLSKQLANQITLRGQSLQAYITSVVDEVLADRTTKIISPVNTEDTEGSHPSIDVLRQKIEAITDTLTAKNKILSPTVDTEKLTTNFISPLTADGQITISGNASISGTLYAEAIESSTIDALKEKLASLAETLNLTPEVKEAPTSGVESTASTLLADLQSEPIATNSAYLNIDSINANAGFFSDYLAVIGQATITDLKINNLLTLGSVLALNGKIDFLAGLMTLNESGQVIINGNLTVTGTIIASQITPPPDQTLDIAIASQSAMLIYSDINQPIATFSGQTAQLSQLELAASGTATISAGTNNVLIHPNKLTDKSQIIVTFNSNYTPASKYWVTKEAELNQFTIFTNYPVNNDVALDWLIIN